MGDFQNQVLKIKHLIDRTTDTLAELAANDQFDDMEMHLAKRLTLLNELTGLFSTREDKQELANYFSALMQRDYSISRVVREERNKIKASLLNMNNIKQYFI